MNALLQNLLKLQTLEFSGAVDKAQELEIASLRGQIPAPVLGHYDRLRVRGKKGLAAIRNQVCTGCHMRQPVGKITVLMRDEDVQLCDICGRYLYLPDQSESQPAPAQAEPTPAAKPAAKPRQKTATKGSRKRSTLVTTA